MVPKDHKKGPKVPCTDLLLPGTLLVCHVRDIHRGEFLLLTR
jgi:hypothetical protein